MPNNQQLLLPKSQRNRDVTETPEPQSLGAAIRGPARLGWALIFTFAVGFGGWAGFAPLAAGAVAPGVISPDGSRRTVQHLEGGIIAAIKARDGDYVEKGEPVMILESVQASAAYDALLEEQRTLLARRARLSAELLKQDRIDFPPELTGASDPKVVDIIEGQRAIFESQRQLHEAQKQVLHERMKQSAEQVGALEAQVEGIAVQLELIADELKGKGRLLDQGLATKTEVRALQRAQAELQGQQGEYIGTIAEIRQKQGEIQSQLLQLEAERSDTLTAEFDDTRVLLAAVAEKLNASRDILQRTVVIAPVSGRVVGSRFRSPGGVVQRGEPIMEIVPTDETLLIDARVSLVDIDIIRIGMPATVHLSAVANFRLPRIDGVVRSISADRITDEATGQAYYLARVEVSRDTLEGIGQEVELVPGMPAEVLLVTAERTMIQYLLEPFIVALGRSFRES